MPRERLQEYLLAAVCMAALVWVAFYGAYAGLNSREAQQAQWIKTEERANDSAGPQKATAPDKTTAESTPSAEKQILPLRGERERTKNGEYVEQNGTEFWPPLLGYRLKVTDTLIALFTALLFAATIGLWLSTRRLWKVARETFEASERAFVFVDGFTPEVTTLADQPDVMFPESVPPQNRGLVVTRFAVQPRWKNGGNTPTRDMRIQVDWRGPGGTLTSYEYRTPPEPFFLAPRAVEPSDIIEMPGANALINEGNIILGEPPMMFIWGRADYMDIFGRPHFVQWCYRLRFERHVGEKVRAHFIQWGEYNRSD
jgi:hypothetical protein